MKIATSVNFFKLHSCRLAVLFVSGILFGLSQWATRNICGRTTVFFRFLQFGKANFLITAVVDLSSALVIMGLGTLGWNAALFAMRAVRKSPARSRAGRGVQKIISWILGIGCYYICVLVPLYVTSKNPWLAGVCAVFLMQYPIHVLLGFATAIYRWRRRRNRQKKPGRQFQSLQRSFSGFKYFTIWTWKYFFFPTVKSYSDSDFAPTEEVGKEKPGEGETLRFADTMSQSSYRKTYFWREWNTDFNYLYLEFEEALGKARKSTAGQSALKDEGSGFQLVAEIKQESEGYRLMALTVLPLNQVLQPGMQFSVESNPDEVGGNDVRTY